MPMPESSVEEIRTSTLRYLRMYEEGSFTISDLAAELAVMAPAYDHAMGGIADTFGELLAAAYRFQNQPAKGSSFSCDDMEQAMTEFRRAEAAW